MQREKICQLAIESISPNVCIGLRVDELRVHPHAIADASHRAFQNMRDPERLPDLAQISHPFFILPHRRATNHFQVRYLRQARQDIVVHAVGEIGVIRIVAQVFEWQNRDTFRRNRFHATRLRLRKIEMIGPFDSFRRDVERPRQNQSDRESNNQENDH